jgi:chromosome segregation ATPase
MEDDYSDDDYAIYFDRAQLLGHLNQLEDDNLFRIQLVQDDEQAVKKINEDALDKYNEMEG